MGSGFVQFLYSELVNTKLCAVINYRFTVIWQHCQANTDNWISWDIQMIPSQKVASLWKQVICTDPPDTTDNIHQYSECVWCPFLTPSESISDTFIGWLQMSWGFQNKLHEHLLQLQLKNAVTVAGRLQQCWVLKWLLILHTDTELS